MFAISEVRHGDRADADLHLHGDAIGVRQTRRYALTGERFGAEEALRIGLVHEVVASQHVETRLAEVLDSIVLGAPGAIAQTKLSVLGANGMLLDDRQIALLAHEGWMQRQSTEGREGTSAFREKRRPAWYSRRPVSEGPMTYSILARDPATGAFGAAVASRFFAVGAICIMSRVVSPRCPPRRWSIRCMRCTRCLGCVRANRPTRCWHLWSVPIRARDQRQFHIIDAAGRIAQHTGANCVTWAGHVRGQDVSVAGNMLAGPQVVQRTLEAYLGSGRQSWPSG